MKAKGHATARPWLLDGCSGGGVGADGYVRAGFKVRCVDNDPKMLLHWWGESRLGDIMDVLSDEDWVRQHQAIHVSPPCQRYTAARELARAQGKGMSKKASIDLLAPVLDVLRAKYDDLPWVVENVPRSPLRDEPGVVRVCGSSFGLKVQRHRLFVSNVSLVGTECDHAGAFDRDPITRKPRPWGVWYTPNDNIPEGGRSARDLAHGMEVMGVGRTVPWDVLKEGIPPAFTEHIGRQLMAAL